MCYFRGVWASHLTNAGRNFDQAVDLGTRRAKTFQSKKKHCSVLFTENTEQVRNLTGSDAMSGLREKIQCKVPLLIKHSPHTLRLWGFGCDYIAHTGMRMSRVDPQTRPFHTICYSGVLSCRRDCVMQWSACLHGIVMAVQASASHAPDVRSMNHLLKLGATECKMHGIWSEYICSHMPCKRRPEVR